MHVLRSVCPNGSQKHIHLACLTPHPKWVICLLLIYPLYWDPDVPGNMLSYLFSCGDSITTLPRALIPTPSCSWMHPKWSGTQITSKNAKISTLDLNNFFLARYFLTKFWETSYLYIMIIYPKFAPILRSQKKDNFLCSGSIIIPRIGI